MILNDFFEVFIKINLCLNQLHFIPVPINYLVLKITLVTSKAGGCGTKTKNSIFNYWFPGTHTFDKISEVSNVVTKAFRSNISYIR